MVTAAPLQCDIGPITKEFGSVPWLLYSCDDGKSLVVISAPGSPAAPFYFMFSPEGRGYHLSGEAQVQDRSQMPRLRILKF